MIENPSIHPKVVHQIARQLNMVAANPPKGVHFVINPDDFLDINAEVSGPEETPYEGGIFRCRLIIPGDFPMNPPKGYFLTKIFHPNVSPAGEICVNTLKKDWDPAKWSIHHIFEVIRCLLIIPFPESALNEDAGRLFMESYDEYLTHARIYTEIHAMPKALMEKTTNNITGSQDEEMVICRSGSENAEIRAKTVKDISTTKKSVKKNDKKKWMKRL
mmetsp:Transcript_57053/g.65063  ORF Transcript_57053/g.65063 Transcript_57053/m.65063 type:complete len:217 (+) Transcript_57053:134-784(+)